MKTGDYASIPCQSLSTGDVFRFQFLVARSADKLESGTCILACKFSRLAPDSFALRLGVG